MNTTKPLILISNDDGITAPGIQALISVMQEIGDVIVVAPDKPQSAMGHAITINQTIRLTETHLYPNVKAYQCSGTPVDCVKIAIDKILPRKADLMVSGINHGANSSINVIYSGTMSAAVEASIDGMPAIGFPCVIIRGKQILKLRNPSSNKLPWKHSSAVYRTERC